MTKAILRMKDKSFGMSYIFQQDLATDQTANITVGLLQKANKKFGQNTFEHENNQTKSFRSLFLGVFVGMVCFKPQNRIISLIIKSIK